MEHEPHLGPEVPDLEDLAAYVDGRLAAPRRTLVEARLARDEEYYTVFLDTVRFQEEEAEPAEREGTVVRPSRWRRPGGILISVGAAAALAAALGVWRTETDWTAHLDPAAIVATGEGWDSPGWPVYRGGEEESPALEELRPIAFRLGVRTVDLRIALAGGDLEAAESHIGQLEGWCEAIGLFPSVVRYEALDLESPDRDLLKREVAEIEAELARDLQDVPSYQRRYATGQWAESARLAAAAGDQETLRRILRSRPDLGAFEEIRPQVEVLQASRKVSDTDVAKIREALGAMIHRLAS